MCWLCHPRRVLAGEPSTPPRPPVPTEPTVAVPARVLAAWARETDRVPDGTATRALRAFVPPERP